MLRLHGPHRLLTQLPISHADCPIGLPTVPQILKHSSCWSLSIRGRSWTPLSHALAQGRAGMVPLLLAHAKKKKADAAGGDGMG